jgi:hypothetical protein
LVSSFDFEVFEICWRDIISINVAWRKAHFLLIREKNLLSVVEMALSHQGVGLERGYCD